eukprot:2379305-Amphidinium_carterae.1
MPLQLLNGFRDSVLENYINITCKNPWGINYVMEFARTVQVSELQVVNAVVFVRISRASWVRMCERAQVLEGVSTDGLRLRHVAEHFKSDREIVMAAVLESGHALEFAAPELQSDPTVVLAAVSGTLGGTGVALQYASEELKGDQNIVLAAVSTYGGSIEYASADLRSNRDFVLATVALDGLALEYASDALRQDHDVVLTAVSEDGRALEYAAREFQGNSEVVMTAIATYPHVLRGLSEGAVPLQDCCFVGALLRRSIADVGDLLGDAT